jgi:hypothetical protein
MGFQQIVEELHIELIVLHNQDSFGHPRSFGCPEPNIRRRYTRKWTKPLRDRRYISS